jgi:hypothetical protein
MKTIGGGRVLSPEFRSWAMESGGFGAAQSKELFGKDYDPTKVRATQGIDEKTTLLDYQNSAKDFYAKSTDWQKSMKDDWEVFMSNFGELVENGTSTGIQKGIKAVMLNSPSNPLPYLFKTK